MLYGHMEPWEKGCSPGRGIEVGRRAGRAVVCFSSAGALFLVAEDLRRLCCSAAKKMGGACRAANKSRDVEIDTGISRKRSWLNPLQHVEQEDEH